MDKKKVFVSGCFDMLHSGHIEFLAEASQYGNLYVCIGSDENVYQLKHRYTIVNESERKFMLEAVKYVHEVRINKGFGILDFLDELNSIKPDIFVVNEDGHTLEKEQLCLSKNIRYIVLKRLPNGDLPARSTTSLRKECIIPFRIDLAGGWLDQPFVSKFYPGPVITVSIEPTHAFNNRSGMASSTRNKAIEIWKTQLPGSNHELNARLLFSYDNPPGTKDISGSQDSIGIVYPALNKLNYNGQYWPELIESIYDESALRFIENHLQLISLGPRNSSYSVVDNTNITQEGAMNLALASNLCWEAIQKQDLVSFGNAIELSFEAQINMFPNMVDESIKEMISQYKNMAHGYKLSGAGGGGYLILVTDKQIEGAITIRIRRAGQ